MLGDAVGTATRCAKSRKDRRPNRHVRLHACVTDGVFVPPGRTAGFP